MEQATHGIKLKGYTIAQFLRVGTHELLARRCEDRVWGHVQFNGGVPGPQRKHLIQSWQRGESKHMGIEYIYDVALRRRYEGYIDSF